MLNSFWGVLHYCEPKPFSIACLALVNTPSFQCAYSTLDVIGNGYFLSYLNKVIIPYRYKKNNPNCKIQSNPGGP